AAALTLTPALLRLVGQRVFWPQGAPEPKLKLHDDAPEPGFWNWVSRGVVARPVLVWIVAVMTLLPLALLGMKAVPDYKPTGELPASAPSVRGMSAFQKHFTAGEVGPLTVLLVSPTDWNTLEGRDALKVLSRGVAVLDNVADVRSLTQPLGTQPAELPPPPRGRWALDKHFLSRKIQAEIDKGAREFYVKPVRRAGGPQYA